MVTFTCHRIKRGFTCERTGKIRRRKGKRRKTYKKGFPKRGCNVRRKFGKSYLKKHSCHKYKWQANTVKNQSRFKNRRIVKCKTAKKRLNRWCLYVGGRKGRKPRVHGGGRKRW